MFIYLSTTKDDDSTDNLIVLPGLLLANGQIKLKAQMTLNIPLLKRSPSLGGRGNHTDLPHT